MPYHGFGGDAFVQRDRHGGANGGPGLQREAVADARRNHVQRSDKSTAPVEDSDGGIPADRTSRPVAPARNRMPAPSNDAGRADPTDPGSEQRLLNQVRRGSASAVAALFERYAPWLRRRARGRLPQWARSGGVATSDLVQDVLHHTFARLTWFESTHVSALRAYLRRAVENRVQDELRRAIRRLDLARLAPGEAPLRRLEDAAPQYQQRLQEELWGRYRDGLKRLKVRDRRLIVGRAELGVQLRAARHHRTPPESGRRAQGAQAGRHSAERGHAAGLQPVASRAPARPGVRRRPPVRNPSGSGPPDVMRDILRWPRAVRAGWRCAVGCRLCDAHRRP